MHDGGVRVDLQKQHRAELEFLTGWGYGNDQTDVARYLIERGLDDLRRSGVIPPYLEGRLKEAALLKLQRLGQEADKL